MKPKPRYVLAVTAAVYAVMTICLPGIAHANSSWHWLTASPMYVLPFAVVMTLALETLALVRFGTARNVIKAFCVVALVNLISFLAPYIIRAINFMPFMGMFSIEGAFNKGPYFIVLGGYLLFTVLFELPAAYVLLKKDAVNAKRLALAVVVSNLLTTAAVAAIERLVCVGSW